MTDRILTNGYFTKIADQLADDLDIGFLTFEEYGLLVYMLQKANKKTGILISNSRSLSNAVKLDRKRVSYLLSRLKKKGVVQNADRRKTEMRQKRGSVNPYAMCFCDHIPYGRLDRDETGVRQRSDRDRTDASDRAQNEKPPEAPLSLTKTESGKFLAKERYNNKESQTFPKNVDSQDKEEFFWKMMDRAAPTFQQTTSQINDFQREIINEILEYPEDKIETVITKAGREGISPNKMLAWIVRGLVNFGKWYSPEPVKVKSAVEIERSLWLRVVKESYRDFKGGKLPENERLPANCIHKKLSLYLPHVKEFEPQLEFTVKDYESVMKLWENRE